MSQANPYAPVEIAPLENIEICKVKVRVIPLLRRSFDLIGDQYWLFVGMTFLALLLGSAVPLGLIMGNVLFGLYTCYRERERKGQTEFSTLFRGFENFLEPFIAYLIVLGIMLAIVIPFTIICMVAIIVPMFIMIQQGGANQPPDPMLFVMLAVFYPVMLAVNLLAAMPFIFTFQLMADRNLRAVDAVKMSFRGVLANFWGAIWFLIATTFISLLAALMCYLPVFLLMPITFGAMHLLYRDVYGPPPQFVDNAADAEVVE